MRWRTHPTAHPARNIIDRQHPLGIRIVVPRQRHAPTKCAAVRVQLGQLLLDDCSVGASRRDITLREGADPTEEVVALRHAEDVRARSVVVGVADGAAGERGAVADWGAAVGEGDEDGDDVWVQRGGAVLAEGGAAAVDAKGEGGGNDKGEKQEYHGAQNAGK